MRKYIGGLASMALLSLLACTSLSEGGRGSLEPDPAHNRRVQYSDNRDAELRRQMNQQASEINRKKNVEEGQNAPATTPPTLRPRQVPNAPVDSTRHNVQRPLRIRRSGNQ
ncbi:hypothetical protein [Pontibacter ruber]|uniref:Lipoprotein n=1 Tax=Pontibacter ruber TaxID=1343895 RepID=A0ABW5D0J6_9BACT|nr:hypothetical protein [Pontibacter ruber]